MVMTCPSSSLLLLRQATADDESSTCRLHSSLSLILSFASPMFISIDSRSSLTLSIHVFCCLPLLLFPSTYPFRAIDGNLLLSILTTYPSHFSLFFLILSMSVSSCPSSFLV